MADSHFGASKRCKEGGTQIITNQHNTHNHINMYLYIVGRLYVGMALARP